MKYLLILFTVLSFGQEKIISEKSDFLSTEVITTTIDNVLKNPKKYENKIIKLDGYLDTQFEGMRIFADSTDYDLDNRKRSIVLEMTSYTPPKVTKKKFATIIGKFRIYKGKFFEIDFYQAKIHRTLLSDASKDFFQEILSIEKSIIDNKIISQLTLQKLICFTDVDIQKKQDIYQPTLDDVVKLKEWYLKNKFDISRYQYGKSIYLIKNDIESYKERCNM